MSQPRRKKHRIYWYTAHWYMECAHCAKVNWARTWSAAFGLLTLHVGEHPRVTS